MAIRRKLEPKCSVCRHPERVRIEAMRVAGVTLRTLADRFSLSTDAIHRHDKRHVPSDLRVALIADVPLAELAKRAADEGVSLLDNLGIVRRTLMSQMLQASAINDRHATAALSGKALDCLREIGKLTGELSRIGSLTINNNANVTVLNSPVFLDLQLTLIRTLAPFPEARAKVIEAMRDLENKHSPVPLTIEANQHVAA
jgi:hypothetical protein